MLLEIRQGKAIAVLNSPTFEYPAGLESLCIFAWYLALHPESSLLQTSAGVQKEILIPALLMLMQYVVLVPSKLDHYEKHNYFFEDLRGIYNM